MSRWMLNTVWLIVMASALFAKEYNLKDILNLAEKRNKNIQLARSDLEFAAAQKKEAWSTALPKINVDLNYNRNFLQNFFYVTVTDSLGREQTSRFDVSFDNEFQLNATLNQTLFGFGKIGNAIKAANYFDKFTHLQYSYQWQSIITQVKKAFYQALLMQKVWEVARQSELSARDNYQNTATKFKSGAVSEFELLQAEVRWKNAIPETMKAWKNYQLSLNNLKILVELPLEEELRLQGSLQSFPALPDTLTVEEVFNTRADFQALHWEKKLQQKRVAVEYSNHLPTLTGNLIYTYGARSNAFRLENDNDNIILALSLNVPIFSGGFTSAQVQKARVDVERVQTRIEMMDDNIRVELQNIYLRLKEALQRIEAARKSVDTAQRAFEIAEARIQNGLATQVELKDSRVFLDQAQLNYYSAIYDYLNAFFDWELATGNVSIRSY